MMKKLLLILSLYFTAHSTHGQNPLIKIWDADFGGNGNDYANCMLQTSDGGFIIGGTSLSGISGDKTEPSLDSATFQGDFWIVKIDSVGVKQWDKTFGGFKYDNLTSFQQCGDGGYILGGYSNSGISGDKSETCLDTNTFSALNADYWIVKTDSLGVKQWDKTFGGFNSDYLYTVRQTKDGGYVLGGASISENNGDRSQPSWGNYDYWIVKTDSLGVKQWDKRFGGNDIDRLYSIEQTTDGGYILGGYSQSDTSSDKSQPRWGTTDYWVVKIDSNGIKQWDKRFGGYSNDELTSIHQTIDGGYILGGKSNSGLGCDITDSSRGSSDYWIVKINSVGIKQWDKRFGGSYVEEFANVVQTSDTGYFMAGASYSSLSGDKSEDNLGQEQSWIVKTDSNGIIQWEKTVFTLGHDEEEEGWTAVQSRDGCFVIANSSLAGIGGNKSQQSKGVYDYWIIKFCDKDKITTSENQFSMNNSQFNIYPNPFENELTVRWDNGQNEHEFILLDITGKEILRQRTAELVTKLNTEKLKAGVYFLNYNTANFKLVKF